MKFNAKKFLLTGTAVVAVATFGTQAHATAADLTLTKAAIWSDNTDAGSGVDTAVAGDNVNTATFVLTVQNDGTTSDGSANTNTFVLGAVTGNTGGVTVTSHTGANLGATIGSITLTNAPIIVTNRDADDANVTLGVTGNVNTGTAGTLAVTSVDADAAKTVAMTVGGNLTVGGAATVTAGTFAGANSSLTVTGNSTFTGGITATAATAGTTATVNLNGATNTGAIVLTDAARSILNVGSNTTTAQSVAGNISGAGTINVSNSSSTGVTFTGTVGAGAGAVVIENGAAALNSKATFKNTVNVASITLGAAGTGTNTVVFDTTGGNFTATGTVTGAIAGENNVINVIGGHTLTQGATAWGGGGNIDTLAISGSGTKLTTGAAVTADAITIGSGSTLNNAAGLVTSTVTGVTNNGAITFTGGTGITGNISGTGTITVTNSAAITGNVGGSAINIAAGQTLTASGNVTATTTNLTTTGTGILALTAAAHNVSTNVVTATNGAGGITLADGNATTTITGNIGSSSAKLATFAVAGNGGNTITTTKNLYVNAYTQSADTLQFLGTTAQVVSGTIAGAGGTITVGNNTTTSDVTFNGAVGGAALNVDTHAKATFAANATLTGAITNTGTLQVNAGKTVQGASVADASVGTYNIGVSSTGAANSNGTIIETADAANYANDTLHFVVASDSKGLLTGAAHKLVSVLQGTSANITGTTVTDNSYIYKFTPVVNGNNVDVTISTEHSVASAVTGNGTSDVGSVLLGSGLSSTTNTQLSAIQGNLVSASSAQGVDNVLSSVQATADGSNVTAAMDASSQVFGITQMRLASLEGQSSGMAAGDMMTGTHSWGQVFGQHANQDARDSVAGYDSNTYGAAVGADVDAFNGRGHVGAALSYARTDANSDNANSTDTKINSYQATLYGDLGLQDDMFLKGMAAYAFNDNNTTRHNVGGVAGLTADGDFNANQFSARAELGRPFALQQGFVLTPTVLADYAYYNADSYTETGAGGANLKVNQDSVSKFDLGVGLAASTKIQDGSGGTWKPGVSASYKYDLVGDQIADTSSFTGGGAAFSTKGLTPARSQFAVGANVTYMTVNNWDFSAEYNYEFKSDYQAHDGLLRAAYKF